MFAWRLNRQLFSGIWVKLCTVKKLWRTLLCLVSRDKWLYAILQYFIQLLCKGEGGCGRFLECWTSSKNKTKIFCSNRMILITLVIPKEYLGTLLWRLLLQCKGKIQKRPHPPLHPSSPLTSFIFIYTLPSKL